MSKSLFEIGTKAEYEALIKKDEDVMYWITDTQELYKGTVRYAVGKEATDEEAGLMSAEDKSFIESLKDLVDSGVISANISVANGAKIGTYGISIYSDEVDDNAFTPAVMSLSAMDNGTSINEEWTADKEHYPWYDCYYDEAYSYIDENKNIKIDNGQINITNESYAQFIPFEMKRYYDGIDLSKMTISMIYITQDGYPGQAEIVNMQYGTDSIRFAWLIDSNVTHVSGNIRFEVQARGAVFDSNGNSKPYVWKSRIGSGISVIQALTFDETVKLDDTWMNKLVWTVTDMVAKSGIEKQVQEAKTAASNAQATVETALGDYYTKTQIDNKLANVKVDLTGYATEDYVQEQINAIPTVPTNVSAFTNDAGYVTDKELNEKGYLTSIPEEYVTDEELNAKGYLTEHQALSNYALKTEIPSLEGLATKTYVKEEIAKVDVSSQLVDYATKTEVESSINTLTSSIETNTTNISSLSNTVTDLQTTINGIDTSPRKTYDVAYNDTEDPEVGENAFVFYEIENGKKEVKKKFTIVGGSGGGTSSTLKIKYITMKKKKCCKLYITTSPIVATVNDKVIIKY